MLNDKFSKAGHTIRSWSIETYVIVQDYVIYVVGISAFGW